MSSSSPSDPLPPKRRWNKLCSCVRCAFRETGRLTRRCVRLVLAYPWRTLLLLLLAVGCGRVCVYFGGTVLIGGILAALNSTGEARTKNE